MKIGIDASRAFMKERTGIEEYSYQVIKHLRKPLKASRVILYIRRDQEAVIKDQKFIIPKEWRIKVIRWPRFWTQLGLSLEILINPIDILFIPAHIVPIIHPKKTIVTVHGLEYEMMPEAYSFWERLYMRVSIKMSLRRSSKIIAVSKNTKKDLMKLYNVPENKIEMIYEGAPKNFQFPISNDQISNYKPYILFIGRLEKRKNIDGIIKAFVILKEKYGIPHKLILAGKPGYGFDKVKYQIQNTKYKNEIILPGFVSEEEKFKLLSQADVFLFPSFYEGFGLPILEAQNCGTPVVTSNTSSLPEVANDGAVFSDPNAPEFIAEMIYRLITDDSWRNGIIKKGYENVRRFNWEKCASAIADVMLIH